MTLEPVVLLWMCACLGLTALVAATTTTTSSSSLHEARQGSIPTVTDSPSVGPGPASLQTSFTDSSPAPQTTTMSPTSGTTATSATSDTDTTTTSTTSSSEPSQSPFSSVPALTTTSNIILLQSSEAPSTTTSSGTSSATPQPSSSSGTLTLTVHNMTTCTSSIISWEYTGEEAALLLSITNIGVDQSYALSRFKPRQNTVGTIQEQLADTDTSASSWTWSSVNLTQGWYEIQGLALATPAIGSNSAPFLITNGTNVACLTGTSLPASSTASPGASTSSSSAAAQTNVADIAGGVAGAVAGVALAIIAGIWLWWSRKRKRSLVGDGGRKRQKWGSLKSNLSIQPGAGGLKPTGEHFHGHSESTEGVLEDVPGSKGSATTTPGESEDDAAIMGEEKLLSPASSSGMNPFDALNTPIHYDRRAPTYHPAPIANEAFRSRSSSAHTSNQSIEQQAKRILSSMETAIPRRSERLSMPTLPAPALSRLPHSHTHTQHTEEYPLTPVTATPASRSISTGAVPTRRTSRTSRKPVPEYNPSALLEDTNTDSVSTVTGGAESSQTHGTGMGTGTSGMPTDSVRKASFGDGRPVHYLIPDMPLPQRD